MSRVRASSPAPVKSHLRVAFLLPTLSYYATISVQQNKEDMYIQLKKVHPAAVVPVYGSTSAAGLDLAACIDEPITLHPGEASKLIPTGVAIYMRDPNVAALILPRSGLGHKKGLILGNGSGVIDADYQGQLFVSACVRPGHEPFTINPEDRIAQLVITPIIRAEFDFIEEFNDNTDRGHGGFGSTGISS